MEAERRKSPRLVFPPVSVNLWGRLCAWAATNRAPADPKIGHDGAHVTATIGGLTAFGRTTNEAINLLADALAREGWEDDRDGGRINA